MLHTLLTYLMIFSTVASLPLLLAMVSHNPSEPPNINGSTRRCWIREAPVYPFVAVLERTGVMGTECTVFGDMVVVVLVVVDGVGRFTGCCCCCHDCFLRALSPPADDDDDDEDADDAEDGTDDTVDTVDFVPWLAIVLAPSVLDDCVLCTLAAVEFWRTR